MDLGNYKIKVNNEAESREAQELFFELGYMVVNNMDCEKGHIVASKNAESPINFDYWHDVKNIITIQQLRDLVVLHRNDVKDANYKSHTDFYYVTEMYDYYFWNGHKWCESTQDSINGLTEIIKSPVEQGLISGADALRALADGKEVEFHYADTIWALLPSCANISIFYDDEVKFRLKPHTITLNIEIPAPFEPKVGEGYFYLNAKYKDGYSKTMREPLCNQDNKNIENGAWRTESEIKQVVAALRGALKNG